MLNCIFCNKGCKNKNSYSNHMRCCPSNPNRNYKNGMTGKKQSDETKQKISNNHGSKRWTPEIRARLAESARKRNKEYFTEERRKEYSIKACNRLSKHSKYSKNYEYNGTILESSYELLFAKYLDSIHIIWKKCHGCRFEYIDEKGKQRGYVPDFYIPQHNVYIDTKNIYLIKKDRFKIEAVRKSNNIHLLVYSIDDIINKRFEKDFMVL